MTEREDFETKLKSISQRCRLKYSPQAGAEVFHYCHATGLNGIVSKKCLWASDIFSLNDASEVDYAMRLVCEEIEDVDPLKPIAEKIRNGALMTVYKKWQSHVCCFSADNDSLSQWRAYGAGGYGFAIGLDLKLLHEYAASNGWMLTPIQYSDAQQRAWANEFSREAADLLCTFEAKLQLNLLFEIVYALLSLMGSIKNPAFEDEQEWRLSRITAEPDLGICFRPIHGAIVSYRELCLPASCFTRVVQGPTLHKDFGERSIRLFLDQNGLGHVAVETSVIPLRSL